MPLLREDGRPVDHCQYPAISHAQPLLACSADGETTILNFEAGAITGTIYRADAVGTFLRDGDVIGWPSVTTLSEIDVFSISGESIEPILEDFVPFGQMGFFNDPNPSRIATDRPRFADVKVLAGHDLYEAAMAELSDDEQSEVLRATSATEQ